MKKALYIILIGWVLLGNLGCKKFLSLNPPSDLSGNNFWRNKSDVERYTNGLYELFREAVFRPDMTAPSGAGEFPFLCWTGDLRGAPLVHPGGGREYFGYLTSNNIKAVVNYSVDFWNTNRFTQWDRFFKTIASANIAIDRIPGIDDPSMSDADKARYLGEAAFMRNLCYFFMIRIYGDVPYYTEPYFNGSLRRAPMAEVLKSCSADLDQYRKGLPWTYDNPALLAVRAMRGSAIVLQMHINMWLAAFDETNQETYYKKVDALGDELWNEGGKQAYELLPLTRTKEIFKGRSREGLFEIPQNVNYGESFGWSAFSDNVLYAPYKRAGITESYIYYIPDFMYELYPQDKPDLRKTAWFNPATMYSGTGKFIMLKYANVFANENAEDVNPDDNQIVFRLPDVNLLQAEALTHLGDRGKALRLVNEVRARAGATPFLDDGEETLLDNIFYERCREFMGEAQYWYDVVRTKRITNLQYRYGFHCSVEQFKAGAWTWPIDPAARNNNPDIVLNQYWLN
ncbi:Starch-binding associating with outer membrane [Niabella drilacis]|uniref:Starch-binding associating with outer membrane n=2 Tax=Niabella drilacis (strain DSM 25811 / CCM 8410 / CCUG 62505 / LMG 26954 / E90) TaxID=1285928 RepID=A0A1G7B667_NIADE|nr:Starch-binding associating with outer membrane [Niabella drilacis]